MDGEAIRKDGERTAWKMTWIATWTAWMDGRRMRSSGHPLLKIINRSYIKSSQQYSKIRGSVKIRSNPAAAHPPIMDILL